jgi:hypothetical protein
MAIVNPTTVRATLAGQIAKGTWTFDYTYEMPDRAARERSKARAPLRQIEK